jgi:hypothetical protein
MDSSAAEPVAERDTLRLSKLQQALPRSKWRPADRGLSGHPPRAEICWDFPPYGTVLMSPDKRLKGAVQVLRRRLAPAHARVDQWHQRCPLGTR